jgi:O-antigen/teichoic acid export membrane protein
MSLLVGVILARTLAPDGFGHYALVVSTAGLLAIVGSMGLGGATIYWMNKRNMSPGAASTLVIRSSATLGLLLGIGFLLLLQYEQYFGDLSTSVIIASSVSLLGQIMLTACTGIFIARMQIYRYIAINLMPVAVILCGLLAAAFLNILDLQTALIITAFGQVGGVMVLLWFVRNDYDHRREFRLEELIPLLRYGAVMNLAYFFYMFGMDGGVILLRMFSDEFSELGYFRSALRLAAIVVMITSAVGPLLFSKYAATSEDVRSRNVERTSRVYWLAILLIVAALGLMSSPVISLLYGDQFGPAVPVLQVMLLGIAARALTSPMLEMYYSSGSPRFSVMVLGINLILMSLLMGLLIPKHGAFGAGVAFAIGNVGGLALAYAIAHWRYGVRLGRCFLITAGDFSFILANLRRSQHRPAA